MKHVAAFAVVLTGLAGLAAFAEALTLACGAKTYVGVAIVYVLTCGVVLFGAWFIGSMVHYGAILIALGTAACQAAELPKTRPITDQQKAVVELGRLLYFDPRLSSDFEDHFRRTGSIYLLDASGQPQKDGRGQKIIAGTSCATCHHPDFGFSDGRPIAVGRFGSRATPQGRLGQVRSPTTLNAQTCDYLENCRMFVDLRARDGVEQAQGPVENPDEMGQQTLEQALGRINAIPGYQQLAQAAFGQPFLTRRTYSIACVAFQKAELVAIDTPLLHYLQGETEAIPDALGRRGAELFKQHCVSCHKPPLFTTGRAANNGFEFTYGGADDIGLQGVTGNPGDRFKRKIPGLVAIAMRKDNLGHESVFRNLPAGDPNYNAHGAIDALLRHYAAGGAFQLAGQTQLRRDPLIDPRVASIRLSASDLPALRVTLLRDLTPADYPHLVQPALPQPPGAPQLTANQP